jgi:hypothetical protein
MKFSLSPVLAASLLPLAAQGAGFASFNQGALAQDFALPAVGAPQILGSGRSEQRLTLDLTNEYVADMRGSELLIVDGERARLAWQYRAGRDGWEWGLELPAVHAGGGFMDRFIEDWHEVFGLPNGGREMATQDRSLYHYERNGRVVLHNEEEGWALGDLRLAAGWAATEVLALRAELKLPTGDEDTLSGGTLGAAVWADWALPFGVESDWEGFAALGLSLNQKGEVLKDQQRSFIPYAGTGLFYRVLPALQLGAQFLLHAPLYQDSALDALDQPGGQLVFGGRWIAPGWSLDLAIQEDLITESSPDFSVHLALRLHGR